MSDSEAAIPVRAEDSDASTPNDSSDRQRDADTPPLSLSYTYFITRESHIECSFAQLDINAPAKTQVPASSVEEGVVGRASAANSRSSGCQSSMPEFASTLVTKAGFQSFEASALPVSATPATIRHVFSLVMLHIPNANRYCLFDTADRDIYARMLPRYPLQCALLCVDESRLTKKKKEELQAQLHPYLQVIQFAEPKLLRAVYCSTEAQ